jgi:HEAT repeat protein
MLAIVAMTGAILGVFFAGRYYTSRVLATHWRQSLKTVPDDRAEMLVASAARLGRPGLPVLVAALGSQRESVSSAGRLWLDRQVRSWENLSNRETQRNVASLAEALASDVDSLSPAARLDAARLANRLLKWRLDGEIVDRRRVTWLCDRVLHAADYTVPSPARGAGRVVSAELQTQSEGTEEADTREDNQQPPGLLEFPDLPQEAQVRSPFASHANRATSPNVVPLPSVIEKPRASDLADAWAMRGHRLGASPPQVSEARIYPSTGERVLVPSSPEGGTPPSEPLIPLRDTSLTECMRRLHHPGFESLAAESELKRRGLNPLQLSIARRVYHPDRSVRLQLVRDLPGIPGIGATDWLMTMAGDAHEEVRLAAITLLATTGDPAVVARVESIARNDPSERIRSQAERLTKRRETLMR